MANGCSRWGGAKGREGAVLGKAGGWKLSQPTHDPPSPLHVEGLGVHHTGSMGQHWGNGDAQRRAGRTPSPSHTSTPHRHQYKTPGASRSGHWWPWQRAGQPCKANGSPHRSSAVLQTPGCLFPSTGAGDEGRRADRLQAGLCCLRGAGKRQGRGSPRHRLY